MFERYTEKARRVIFFARYEASVWGGELIDNPHLLLGLWREDKALFFKLLQGSPLEKVPELLGLVKNEQSVSVSVDMPLTTSAKRALVFATEEADSMGDPHVGTGHMLLGLLREPGPARRLLEERGLDLATARAVVSQKENVPVTVPSNRRIVESLRADFKHAIAGRLIPELEPAVVYHLRPGTAQ